MAVARVSTILCWLFKPSFPPGDMKGQRDTCKSFIMDSGHAFSLLGWEASFPAFNAILRANIFKVIALDQRPSVPLLALQQGPVVLLQRPIMVV